VGNNITPRGFPLTKQAQFTALQRDGMNVYYDQGILFAQADRFTRLSNFVGSAPGGPRRLILDICGQRAGGLHQFHFARRPRRGRRNRGDVQYDTNSAHRFGFDSWIAGGLSDRTSYAVGAWYRADDSTRSPGFTANKGGEINANLKHLFADDRGYIRFEFQSPG